LDDKPWKTVALNVTEPSIALDPTWITGAKRVKLRVIAVNGLHHATVTSDELALDRP
jgi:hypothetical protein